MIYVFQAYYIICTLVLAGKDADSYQLKDKNDNALSAVRVRRWHRDGLILAVLFLLPLLKMQPIFNLQPAAWWKTCLACGLIRLVFFDIPFNHWSSLSIYYLGGTAWVDRQLVKLFGQQVAIRKTIIFFLILIASNLLNQFYGRF